MDDHISTNNSELKGFKCNSQIQDVNASELSLTSSPDLFADLSDIIEYTQSAKNTAKNETETIQSANSKSPLPKATANSRSLLDLTCLEPKSKSIKRKPKKKNQRKKLRLKAKPQTFLQCKSDFRNGIWVQCCIESCQKWRFLKNVAVSALWSLFNPFYITL